MKTKMPIVSYVVTCKYKTNSAGFTAMHRQIFSNKDFAQARKTAFEYVEAAREFMDKNEVKLSTKCYKNPSGVNIKDKKAFADGIQIYMRINEDFNQSGCSDKKDSTYLIAAFHPLSDDFRQKIKAGRLAEKSYYKILNQNTFEKDQFIIDYQEFEQEKTELKKLKTQSYKEIEFVPFIIYFSIKDVFESICAFANSGGGKVILGQDEKFEANHSESKINLLCEKFWKRTILEFPEIEDYLIVYKRNYVDCKFLEIEVIPTAFHCLFRGEYFTRTIHGNVMDLEKSL